MIPILAEMMDLDPMDVERLTAAAEAWQAEQQAREDQMMQREAENQMALAKAGAQNKASTGSSAKKTS